MATSAFTTPELDGKQQEPVSNPKFQAPSTEADPGSQPQTASNYGPNNEELEKNEPEIVSALRDLIYNYRREGIVSRRQEIRRIRQARLFWAGLQYNFFSSSDMSWHLPFELTPMVDAAQFE